VHSQTDGLARRDLVDWLEIYTMRVPNLVKAMTAILVAEDDPGICDFLTDVLEVELAATVRCERTGSLALRAIETAGFDLAIIDVNMPEISGYELARRAANRNIPTLLSSGHPDADATLKKLECPYLAKPYLVTDLICESAKAITQAGENIRRIKASLAKLAATTEDLKADLAESKRLMEESKAILAGRALPEPEIPSDVIDEWLIRLGPRPNLG
jgi:DNA-binding NtrC family response regulator